MASRTTENTSKLVMKRKAIDSSGTLGSFYDLYRDQISENLNGKTRKPKVKRPKTAHCKLIHDKNENWLQMIGIEDGLRLNILLNFAPKTNLASVIDYSYPITEYTRFLHYTYTQRIESLRDKGKKIRKQSQSSKLPVDATHFISSVSLGIEFIAVLQLPEVDQMAAQIDIVLNRLCSNLSSTKSNILNLTSIDENTLQEITSTNIYSNTPALTSMKTIRDIYLNIYQLETDKTNRQPIEYKLRCIGGVHLLSNSNENTLNARYETSKKEIGQYLLHLSNSFNYIKSFLTNHASNSACDHLNKKYDEANVTYLNEIDRLKNLVVDLRKNGISIFQLEETLHSEQQRTLKREVDGLFDEVKHLEVKEQMINDLQQKHFHYYKVVGDDVRFIDNTETAVRKLIEDNGLVRVLCSNDTLNESELLQFNQLRDRLIEEHRNNPELRLFYADFSACSFRLPHIIILPKDDANNHTEIQESMETETLAAPSTDNVVNILLLGESGVGKSTFINAFVNYLKYETMKEAESNKPVVLIPVSFMITTGENFDEHTVKFGDCDETNNEDFDHPGQSVTQRCKSYVFNLSHLHGKKLRIIDTPGFGDTRGLDQDDLNMQHILEYVNNFTHLNAVCFLLKPNASRLTNFFRICLMQLLDLLTPTARQNILFCFTNARTTFYTPGDTAPPLRTLLNSFPVKDIPFAKMNTFCFDNESFRYLVALQNAIQFTELDRDEYEKSWSTSVKESNRLLGYICDTLRICHINDQSNSVKHAQMEIVSMARSILETIRNIFRNIILWDNNETTMLSPTIINRPTSVYIPQAHHTDQLNRFSIQSYSLREYPNKPIASKYGFNQQISTGDIAHMRNQVDSLFDACITFGQFLRNSGHYSKKDPFLDVLTQMIDEEKQICSKSSGKLLKELKSLKDNYEQRMNEIKPNQNDINLDDIYGRIQITRNYPDIQEQMNAVKKEQENMMQASEYEVPDSFTNTSNIEITSL